MLLAAAIYASLAGSAQATVVTVGSPLTGSFSLVFSMIGNPATIANTTLPETGAQLTSPIAGTIVRWRIVDPVGGPFRLRVLTPASGGQYTGAGTGSPQVPSGTGVQTLPANLPIQAGDIIAVDNANATDNYGFANVPGAGFVTWDGPPLADGSTRAPDFTSSDEAGINADVASKPSNAFTFGKVKDNKKKGTATIAVNVPGAGTLSLTGKGVKTQRAGGGAVASKAVTAAGLVKLLVKAKGSAKKKLNKAGTVKVKVSVTYTPSETSIGGVIGDPNAEAKRVKLVKKLG
jgi:hypothetical protein